MPPREGRLRLDENAGKESWRKSTTPRRHTLEQKNMYKRLIFSKKGRESQSLDTHWTTKVSKVSKH